jgi:hypothetical protein
VPVLKITEGHSRSRRTARRVISRRTPSRIFSRMRLPPGERRLITGRRSQCNGLIPGQGFRVLLREIVLFILRKARSSRLRAM